MSPKEIESLTSEEYSYLLAKSEFIINTLRYKQELVNTGKKFVPSRTSMELDLDQILYPEKVQVKQRQSAQAKRAELFNKHKRLVENDLKSPVVEEDVNLVD